MNNLADNLGDWILLVALIVGLASTTMETVVKPFLQGVISRLNDPVTFKGSNYYAGLVRAFTFMVAVVEGAPFAEQLNIFNTLGADVPDATGVLVAAVTITFFSKQLHDVATFVEMWIANKSATTTE